MAGENSGDSTGDPESKRGLLINFSSIVTILILGLAAIVLAYIGGVMSGRQSGARTELATVAQPEKPEGETDQPESQEIIPAEDLEFARVLRGETRKKAEKPPDPPPPAEPATPEAQPAPNPAPPKVGTPEGIQDYVFQAGAFRDENGADKLRQRLEGHGLRTRLEKNGKLFIVLIMLRGNEERAEEIRQLARDLKLGELVTRSRKPANRLE